MFGFGKTRAIEKEMADWLAHPMEFGVPPKTVRLKRTYRGEVADDDLMLAYWGWAWLFPALQAGNAVMDFESLTEEPAFTAKKLANGFDEIRMTSRYKIGTSELFEFKGTSRGRLFTGAGNTESEVAFDAADPRSALPPIYFLLGREVIRSMR